MKRSSIIALIITFAFCPNTAYGGEDMQLPYKSAITVTGENTYKEIQLTKEIYNLSRNSMRDLRIIDANGAEVPYFSYDGDKSIQTSDMKFKGEKVDSFIKDGHEYVDFHIPSEANKDVYGNCLVLEAGGNNFAKNIEVWGSYDGLNWVYAASGLIYDVNTVKNSKISFGETVKYSYYRLQIPNNSENISLKSLELQYFAQVEEKREFTDTFIPDYSVEEKQGETIIKISSQEFKNIKISSIKITTDSMFQRKFHHPFGTQTLYNLTFDNLTIADTNILIDGRIYDSHEDFTISIANGDDKPVNIQGIEISFECKRLVFKDDGMGEYFLFFGNENVNAPRYDITGYSEYILRENIDLCYLDLPEKTAYDENQNEKIFAVDETLILNVVLGVVSIVLIAFILKAVKKNGEKAA